eukprot:gene1349-1704_t
MFYKETIIFFFTLFVFSNAIPFGTKFNGEASWFTDTGLGACGKPINANSEFLVAAPEGHWTTSNPNKDPICNNVYVKVTYNGKTITVPVKDQCPSQYCPTNKIDLSKAAFKSLADEDLGIIPVTWEYVSGSGSGGSTTTSTPGSTTSTTGSSSGCGKKKSVSSGDTCYTVYTSKCGYEWNEGKFYAANPNVDCDNLQVGQQLCCGSGSSGSTTGGGTTTSPGTTTGGGNCLRYSNVASGDSCWAVWTSKCSNVWDENTFYSVNPGVDCNNLQVGQQLCCARGSSSSTTGSSGCSRKSTVQSGDTCYAVFTSKCGNEWDENTFFAANPNIDCNNLQIGQQLCFCMVDFSMGTGSCIKACFSQFKACLESEGESESEVGKCHHQSNKCSYDCRTKLVDQ